MVKKEVKATREEMAKHAIEEAVAARTIIAFPNYKELSELNPRLQKDKGVQHTYRTSHETLVELETLNYKGKTEVKGLDKSDLKKRKEKEEDVQEYARKMDFIQSLNNSANKLDNWKSIELLTPSTIPALDPYEKKWSIARNEYDNVKRMLGFYYDKGSKIIDPVKATKFDADHKEITETMNQIKSNKANLDRLAQLRKEVESLNTPGTLHYVHDKYSTSYNGMLQNIDTQINQLKNTQRLAVEKLRAQDREFSRKFQITLIEEEKGIIDQELKKATSSDLHIREINPGEFDIFLKTFTEVAQEQSKTLNKMVALKNREDHDLRKVIEPFQVTGQGPSKRVEQQFKAYQTFIHDQKSSLNAQIGLIPKKMEIMRKALVSQIKNKNLNGVDPTKQIEFIMPAAQMLRNIAKVHEELMKGVREPAKSDITKKLAKEYDASTLLISELGMLKRQIGEYNSSTKTKSMTAFRADLVKYMKSDAFHDLPKALRKDVEQLNKSLLAQYEQKLTIGEKVSNFFRRNKHAVRQDVLPKLSSGDPNYDEIEMKDLSGTNTDRNRQQFGNRR